MALVIKNIIKAYFYLNYDVSDPRTNPWPLMYTPWPVLSILIGYLYFVFKIGPKFMEKRKAYNLERLLVVYNLLQILACIYIVYRNIVLTWGKYSFLCEPVDYESNPDSLEIASLIYCYFIIKVIDLLDTVFFILRKKQNQVTFLHVYHHTGMVGLAWATTKFLAGGHSIYVTTLNSFVHVVMYTYYLLTAWDPEYKKSVWWKKHITQLQIFQFLTLMILFTQIAFIPSCTYPVWTLIIFVPQNLFMLILFCDFYYKAYIKKKPDATEQSKVEESTSSSSKLTTSLPSSSTSNIKHKSS